MTISYFAVQTLNNSPKYPGADFGDGVLVDSRTGKPISRATWISPCTEDYWYKLLEDWEDDEIEDSSPYCECNEQPTEDEFAEDQCSACGKPLGYR